MVDLARVTEKRRVEEQVGTEFHRGNQREQSKSLQLAEQIKALWVMEPGGPCLFKLVLDGRFNLFDEDLLTGFFVALQTFAESIGSGDAVKLDLRDLTFRLLRTPTTIVVGASERDVDVTLTLSKISSTFDEYFARLENCTLNFFIPADIQRLGQELTPRIRRIILGDCEAESASLGKPMKESTFSEKHRGENRSNK